MIDALVAGRLFGQPIARTAKNGSQFATAKLRVGMPDGETQWVNVIAFSHSAAAALLALQDGDSAALAGELKLSTYQAKDGATRISIDLTCHAVLTAYHVSRKRAAVLSSPRTAAAEPTGATATDGAQAQQPTSRDFDDAVPF